MTKRIELERKDSDSSGKDSGKDLSIDDDKGKGVEREVVHEKRNSVGAYPPPPRQQQQRPMPEKRHSIGPGSLQLDARRMPWDRTPPPGDSGRSTPRFNPLPEGRMMRGARPGASMENRPPANPRPVIIMPAPSVDAYTLPVNEMMRYCPNQHRLMIHTPNVHHQIICMVCKTEKKERWLCSYCALRCCSRCKSEFKAGSTFDQVAKKAKNDPGWSTGVGAPERPGPSAWDIASRFDSPVNRGPQRRPSPRGPYVGRPPSPQHLRGRPGPSNLNPDRPQPQPMAAATVSAPDITSPNPLASTPPSLLSTCGSSPLATSSTPATLAPTPTKPPTPVPLDKVTTPASSLATVTPSTSSTSLASETKKGGMFGKLMGRRDSSRLTKERKKNSLKGMFSR